jgi:hypothetical protein
MGDPLFGTERLPILPEWSPDGTKIAVALADGSLDTDDLGCVWSSETCRSGLAIIPYEGAIGTPEILVENGGDEYHFYPSWSPDGQYIVFASASYDMMGDPYQKSISNDNAVLRLVRATGGPYTCPSTDCWELSRGAQYNASQAAAGLGRRSTWPKFTPFAQDGGQIMFISLNSMIEYGHIEPPFSQLWMFAVDLRFLDTGDPSFPPVWLPLQEPEFGGLTPYWTELLPCNVDPEGGCSGCVASESCIVRADNSCQCEVVVR